MPRKDRLAATDTTATLYALQGASRAMTALEVLHHLNAQSSQRFDLQSITVCLKRMYKRGLVTQYADPAVSTARLRPTLCYRIATNGSNALRAAQVLHLELSSNLTERRRRKTTNAQPGQ